MKKVTNILILFVAFVFLINANGIIIFKHLCNSERIANYSLINSPSCEKENKASENCCEEKANPNNSCCEHTQSFSKFTYDGFTANLFEIKKMDFATVINFYTLQSIDLVKQCRVQFQGLSPPYPNYYIKQFLQPSLEVLQSYLC